MAQRQGTDENKWEEKVKETKVAALCNWFENDEAKHEITLTISVEITTNSVSSVQC